MPYAKTKDNRLVNEVTLGDGYPLSNDLQPLKVGGEASPIEMSTSLPDDSDNAKVKVRGDLEVTGGLNFKNDVEVDLSFDDLSLSGDLTVDTSTLKVDSSNNRVGIGTTSPIAPLHIESTINALADTDEPENCHLLLRNAANDTNEGVGIGFLISAQTDDIGSSIVYKRTGSNAKGELRFNVKTNTIDDGVISQAMVIDDSANVGIGTTSPTADLHINSANSTKLYLTCSDSNPTAAAAIRFSEQEDGANNYFELDYSGSANTLAFHSNNQGNMFTLDRSNNRIFTDTAKVGIGISVPTTTLDVEGTVSYKHTAFTTAGPTDSIDVSDTTVLEVDTSSNNVTIGGFSGGVQGQVLYIVKTDTTNFIQLEHDETPAAGSHQKIFLTSGADERVVGYGGYTLYCNGTNWYSLSNPTGAADAG